PDPAFDMVVPRCNVGIADRPVDRDAFALVGGEIEIAMAIALPSPGERSAADMIAADPVEATHLGVGMLVVLHEPMVPLVVDSVAGADLLEIVFVDFRLRRAPAGIAEIPRVHRKRCVVLAVLHLAPALEHKRLEALLAQLLGGPASADAAADHDGIECALLACSVAEIWHGFPRPSEALLAAQMEIGAERKRMPAPRVAPTFLARNHRRERPD